MYNRKHYGFAPTSFGGLLEGLFENGMPTAKGDFWYTSSAPVNISETDKSFELNLVAPGLKKEDFKISLNQDILTISYDKKEESEEKKEETDVKWNRNEYHFRSFKRSFTLNDKVDAAGINAKYTDGILYVTLPKKENAAPSTQEINVN